MKKKVKKIYNHILNSWEDEFGNLITGEDEFGKIYYTPFLNNEQYQLAKKQLVDADIEDKVNDYVVKNGPITPYNLANLSDAIENKERQKQNDVISFANSLVDNKYDDMINLYQQEVDSFTAKGIDIKNTFAQQQLDDLIAKRDSEKQELKPGKFYNKNDNLIKSVFETLKSETISAEESFKLFTEDTTKTKEAREFTKNFKDQAIQLLDSRGLDKTSEEYHKEYQRYLSIAVEQGQIQDAAKKRMEELEAIDKGTTRNKEIAKMEQSHREFCDDAAILLTQQIYDLSMNQYTVGGKFQDVISFKILNHIYRWLIKFRENWLNWTKSPSYKAKFSDDGDENDELKREYDSMFRDIEYGQKELAKMALENNRNAKAEVEELQEGVDYVMHITELPLTREPIYNKIYLNKDAKYREKALKEHDKIEKNLTDYIEQPLINWTGEGTLERILGGDIVEMADEAWTVRDLAKKRAQGEQLSAGEQMYFKALSYQSKIDELGLRFEPSFVQHIGETVGTSIEMMAVQGATKNLVIKGGKKLLKKKIGQGLAGVIAATYSPLTARTTLENWDNRIHMTYDEDGNIIYETSQERYDAEIDEINSQLEWVNSELKIIDSQFTPLDGGVNTPDNMRAKSQFTKEELLEMKQQLIARKDAIRPVNFWEAYAKGAFSTWLEDFTETKVEAGLEHLMGKVGSSLASRMETNVTARALTRLTTKSRWMSTLKKDLKRLGFDEYVHGLFPEWGGETINQMIDISPIIGVPFGESWGSAIAGVEENWEQLLDPKFHLTTVFSTYIQNTGMRGAMGTVRHFTPDNIKARRANEDFLKRLQQEAPEEFLKLTSAIDVDYKVLTTILQTKQRELQALEKTKDNSLEEKQKYEALKQEVEETTNEIYYKRAVELFDNKSWNPFSKAHRNNLNNELDKAIEVAKKVNKQENVKHLEYLKNAIQTLHTGIESVNYGKEDMARLYIARERNKFDIARIKRRIKERNKDKTLQTYEDNAKKVFEYKDGKYLHNGAEIDIYSQEAFDILTSNIDPSQEIVDAGNELTLLALERRHNSLNTAINQLKSRDEQKRRKVVYETLSEIQEELENLSLESETIDEALATKEFEVLVSKLQSALEKEGELFSQEQRRRAYSQAVDIVKNANKELQILKLTANTSKFVDNIVDKLANNEFEFERTDEGTINAKKYKIEYEGLLKAKRELKKQKENAEKEFEQISQAAEKERLNLVAERDAIARQMYQMEDKLSKEFKDLVERTDKIDKELEDLRDNIKEHKETLSKKLQTFTETEILSEKRLNELRDIDKKRIENEKKEKNSAKKALVEAAIKAVEQASMEEEIKEASKILHPLPEITENSEAEVNLSKKYANALNYLGMTEKEIINNYLREGFTEQDFRDVLEEKIRQKHRPKEGYNEKPSENESDLNKIKLDEETISMLAEDIKDSGIVYFSEYLALMYGSKETANDFRKKFPEYLSSFNAAWNRAMKTQQTMEEAREIFDIVVAKYKQEVIGKSMNLLQSKLGIESKEEQKQTRKPEVETRTKEETEEGVYESFINKEEAQQLEKDKNWKAIINWFFEDSRVTDNQFDEKGVPIYGTLAWAYQQTIQKLSPEDTRSIISEIESTESTSNKAFIANHVQAVKATFDYINSKKIVAVIDGNVTITHTSSITKSDSKIVNLDKLLLPDRLAIGTKFTAKILDESKWSEYNVEVPLADKYMPTSKTITFKEFFDKLKKDNPNATDEQIYSMPEFQDNVPIILIDASGEAVTYLTRPNYYNKGTVTGETEVEQIKNIEIQRNKVKMMRSLLFQNKKDLSENAVDFSLVAYKSSSPIMIPRPNEEGKVKSGEVEFNAEKSWYNEDGKLVEGAHGRITLSDLVPDASLTIFETSKHPLLGTSDKKENISYIPKDGVLDDYEGVTDVPGRKVIIIPTYVDSEGKQHYKPMFLSGWNEITDKDINTLQIVIKAFMSEILRGNIDADRRELRTLFNDFEGKTVDIKSSENLKKYGIFAMTMYNSIINTLGLDASKYKGLAKENEERVRIIANSLATEGQVKSLREGGISIIDKTSLQQFLAKHVYHLMDSNKGEEVKNRSFTVEGNIEHIMDNNKSQALRYNLPINKGKNDSRYEINIDDSGNLTVTEIAKNTNEFLTKRLKTNQMIFNIGTNTNPVYTTEVQPLLFFAPSNQIEAIEILANSGKNPKDVIAKANSMIGKTDDDTIEKAQKSYEKESKTKINDLVRRARNAEHEGHEEAKAILDASNYQYEKKDAFIQLTPKEIKALQNGEEIDVDGREIVIAGKTPTEIMKRGVLVRLSDIDAHDYALRLEENEGKKVEWNNNEVGVGKYQGKISLNEIVDVSLLPKDVPGGEKIKTLLNLKGFDSNNQELMSDKELANFIKNSNTIELVAINKKKEITECP